MKRSLDSIGVRLEIHKDRFPELIKLENQCRLMMRSAAWIADYPDGDNFMQLLYGPNSGQSNNACYRSPEFDQRYEKSRLLPDGPERNKLYREMTRHHGSAIPSGSSPTAATATCCCSRTCGLQASIRCCTPSGCTSTLTEAGSSALLAYLVRRLWQFVPTLLGVVLLVFFLFNWVGGDPAYLLAGKISNPEQIENIRRQLGVDQPYYVQLWIFLKQIATARFRRELGDQRARLADLRHAPRAVADGARAAARRSARCSRWRRRCWSRTCAARSPTARS